MTAPNRYAIDPGAPVTALDSDQDGLTDEFERLAGTDPLSADTDHDGIGDAAEWAAGTPAGTIPGVGGVAGLGSFAQNVLAGAVDTDQDGLSDDYEAQIHTDPTQADSDHDGLPDSLEVTLGTNPNSADTDQDGLTDGAEVRYGTNP